LVWEEIEYAFSILLSLDFSTFQWNVLYQFDPRIAS